MSVRKRLFGVPATLLGILLGLVAGIVAVAKELLDERFPKIGLIILLGTPLITFIFEQLISRAFPEAYWEKVAGNLLLVYRYVINQGFRLRFIYEMRFIVSPENPPRLEAGMLFEVLNAEPGGEPEPAWSGTNFLHLRFREPPFLVSLTWHLNVPSKNDLTDAMTIFTIRMEPEIRDLLMRRAKNDIDGIIMRLSKVQESLILLFKVKPETLAVADAWLGDAVPEATPIRRVRTDSISAGEYRVFPGLLHVAGENLAVLGAVYRYVGTLEEPPDSQE